jgi:competence protein ComEC
MSGNPTFSKYLLKRGAISTIFLYYPNYRIIKKSKNSFSRWICNKRAEIFEKIKDKMPRKTFAYFSNIFLGTKQKPIKKARHYFQYWGISHHLARSGLHIALFILTWGFILSLAPIPFLIKHLLLILLCTLYALLSWTSISFIRAISIFFLYEAGKIFNKQTNIMYFLFLVALTVLVFNPIQLFFLDFQLSFGLTFAIIYCCAKKRIPCPRKAV